MALAYARSIKFVFVNYFGARTILVRMRNELNWCMLGIPLHRQSKKIGM
jgi:hypothetical protein